MFGCSLVFPPCDRRKFCCCFVWISTITLSTSSNRLPSIFRLSVVTLGTSSNRSPFIDSRSDYFLRLIAVLSRAHFHGYFLRLIVFFFHCCIGVTSAWSWSILAFSFKPGYSSKDRGLFPVNRLSLCVCLGRDVCHPITTKDWCSNFGLTPLCSSTYGSTLMEIACSCFWFCFLSST